MADKQKQIKNNVEAKEKWMKGRYTEMEELEAESDETSVTLVNGRNKSFTPVNKDFVPEQVKAYVFPP